MPTRHRFALWVNDRFFYGWVMLAIGFLGLFASGPGQSFNISIFFNPLIDELDLSLDLAIFGSPVQLGERTALSLAYALGTAIAALGLSYMGRLVDRHGPRFMLAAISLALGLVCLLFPFVINIVALLLAFTALRFLGQGSLMLASNNLVSQWFSRRRGFALSIISIGFALGSAGYPPVVQWLIDTIGWRNSWIWLGILVWALMIPACLLLVVNRPEDIRLAPDGGGDAPDESGEGSTEMALEDSWTRREAVRTFTFWILAIGLANPSAFITGVIIHQISIFELQGLTPQMAAFIFTPTAISMVVFMLIFGLLLDRISTRIVLSVGILLMAVTMWLIQFVHDLPMAIAYGIVLGACQGAMMTNFSYVWPRYYGRKHLGSIQGLASTIIIIGASLGPIPFAFFYDWLGTYTESLLIFSLFPLGFGIAVGILKPPQRAGTAGTRERDKAGGA